MKNTLITDQVRKIGSPCISILAEPWQRRIEQTTLTQVRHLVKEHQGVVACSAVQQCGNPVRKEFVKDELNVETDKVRPLMT